MDEANQAQTIMNALGTPMDIEFRVFQKGKLIFRKAFAPSTFDRDLSDQIALQVVEAFSKAHPGIRLDDPGITTVQPAQLRQHRSKVKS